MAVTVIGNKLQVEVLADESTKTQLDELNVKYDDLDSRVDTILTTPAESVSAEEIIDARQGEVTLGENITKVKSLLADIVTNANQLGADPLNADNTAFIQTALNKKGLVTITKPGIYNTGRLVIDDDTTFKLSDGVVLRRKDLTNHHLITNKGHVLGYRNRNISLIGGEIDFNISGQNGVGSGSLATDPQAWAQIGILFHNVDNLTISNIKKIGNEAKYCFLICDVNGFVANDIIFDNESDGLHFQPPFSNAHIKNIGGWCEDDTISFTNGDYATYALGNYGDMENVIIENIVGGQKGGVYTDQLVKVVGSGLDGLSKFKNFTIRNLSGGVLHHAIHIMGGDDGDGESRLSSTHIENFIVENVNVELGTKVTAYIRCNANSGDIVIRNVNVKQNTNAFFNFQEAGLKSVVIDGVFNYDTPETPISTFNASIIASGQIDKMILNNINLKLDVTNGYLLYIPSGSINEVNISNSKLDMNNQGIFALGSEGERSLNIKNSIINGNLIVGSATKTDVRVTNSIITSVMFGAYLEDGAEISVLLDDNSIFNNFNLNVTSALRKIRLNGKGLIYKKDLSTINNAKYGDIITSGGSTETLLGLVSYNSDGWSKASFAPFKVTQNIEIGTISGHATIEKTYYITEYVSDINKMVTATPTFVLPSGLVFTAYNRDSNRIRLIVANVTDNPIVVPDGNWVFNVK